MTDRRPGSFGGLLVAGLLVLSALALGADVVAMGAAEHRHSTGSGTVPLDDRLVRTVTLQAAPGDEVWALAAPGPFDAPVSTLDFYVLERGQGQAVAQGASPSAPLLQRLGIPADACCDGVPVHLRRPAGGTDVDVVWVLHYSADVRRPTEPAARHYFDAWAEAATQPKGPSPVAVAAWARSLHAGLVGLAALALLAALVLAARWARALRRPPASAGMGAREGLVGVAAAAELHLRRWRTAWLALGVPLLLALWLLIDGILSAQQRLAGPSSTWARGPGVVLAGLVVACVACWAVVATTAHLALVRWRSTMASAPL